MTTGVGQHAPILVVEDDQAVREVICWALEDEGLPYETATTGDQAVERGTRQRPALVLLDWGLPVRMGDEVADALREAHGAALPIVLLTADGRSAEKARRVGAVAYFHKPFDMDAVLDCVRSVLGAD